MDNFDETGPETAEPLPVSSARFSQARAAQSMAVLEDYAEMIDDLTQDLGEARITDIAARMGVTHPTATKAVARLKREGLAMSRPYRGVFLTETGAALAARVRARHRTVVDLLVAVGVPQETAELDAEGLEHHVSEVTLHAFEAFLARRS
ncbi:MAG: manganese-binding transcriptional regulator MntR [Paenirhodobacter sp.]|uniref:manganese-binding transcriptional regulator MntR n=1 Tax=Paenirhodobacter sp. TaxID=1965326 RepID=UPI003D105DCB